MKTRILALILAGIFGLTFVQANTIDDLDKESRAKVTRTVNSMVKYPAFAVEQQIEGEVFVNFTINADGTIKVLKVNSGQQDLKEYVITELNKLRLSIDKDLVNKDYNMKFTFKLL